MRTFVSNLCLFLILLLVLCSCSQQAHHSAAPAELHEQILNGMRTTYSAIGQNPSQADNKTHRNLAYRLALHAQDKAATLELIRSGQIVDQELRSFAENSIALVERQKPGYPVKVIFKTLLGFETLDSDQQLLLLGCTVQLLAESAVRIEKPGLKR